MHTLTSTDNVIVVTKTTNRRTYVLGLIPTSEHIGVNHDGSEVIINDTERTRRMHLTLKEAIRDICSHYVYRADDPDTIIAANRLTPSEWSDKTWTQTVSAVPTDRWHTARIKLERIAYNDTDEVRWASNSAASADEVHDLAACAAYMNRAMSDIQWMEVYDRGVETHIVPANIVSNISSPDALVEAIKNRDND